MLSALGKFCKMEDRAEWEDIVFTKENVVRIEALGANCVVFFMS